MTTTIPKKLSDDVERLASESGRSTAEILADLVARGLAARRQMPPKSSNGLVALGNMQITGGPTDLSTKADYYLYGEG